MSEELEQRMHLSVVEDKDHRLRLAAEDVDTLRNTYGSDLNQSEFRLFIAVAQERGLNPLNRQIHAMKVGGKMTIQTSIDGFRLIAQRTGMYAGQTEPQWCGPDGVWHDVWLEDAPPKAARVGVIRRGFEQPMYATALYREYVQTNKDGRPNMMWSKMSVNQLAKCAEALALRKAFPEELSGVYTDDEMGQANNDAVDTRIVPSQPGTPREKMRQDYNSLDREGQKILKDWWNAGGLPKGKTWPADTFAQVPDEYVDAVLKALHALVVERRYPDPHEPPTPPDGDGEAPQDHQAGDDDDVIEGVVVEEVPSGTNHANIPHPAQESTVPPESSPPQDVLKDLCRNLELSPPQRLDVASRYVGRRVRKLDDLSDKEANELGEYLAGLSGLNVAEIVEHFTDAYEEAKQ